MVGEATQRGSGQPGQPSPCRKGVGRKSRRSHSSIDSYSIVPAIGGEELLNNKGTVSFGRSSSVSAGTRPTFGVDHHIAGGGRKKSSRGLIIPWLMHKRMMRKKDDSCTSGEQSYGVKPVMDEGELELERSDSDGHDSANELFIPGTNSKSKSKELRSKEPVRLSEKYEPKLFDEIVGHEINIRALSNAIQKGKIAPLYLFHGSRGTGKSCTAQIFAMASNCEASWPCKPCWTCRGCSRSLYLADLCSGATASGFERIKTLVNTTDFAQTITGLKIFMVEDCHLLHREAWEELLSIVETSRGSIVFVLITEDPNGVPGSVSSRCQKFGFQKLKDVDITLKLGRIVAQEGIRIDREALCLVTQKAQGSLREAENILDQLALLSSRITSQIVRQLVGLVAEDKLTELLDTAVSLDPINTARLTKELIATGIEPQALISQLASRVGDILSFPGTSSATWSKEKNRKGMQWSSHTPAVSERLCNALKILVETEKQLQFSNSGDRTTTWVVAALLQIASQNTTGNRANFVVPQDIAPSKKDKTIKSGHGGRQKIDDFGVNGLSNLAEDKKHGEHQNSNVGTTANAGNSQNALSDKGINSSQHSIETNASLVQMSNMEQVWNNILASIQSQYIREFLHQQGKLVSLTVSRANAIVHLVFKRLEDRKAAERSEESISNAFKEALGCPVIVNLSLQPTEFEVINNITNFTRNSEAAGDAFHSKQQLTQLLPTSEQPYSSDGKLMLRHSANQKYESASSKSSLRAMTLYETIRQGQLNPSDHASLTQRSRDDEYICYLDTRHTAMRQSPSYSRKYMTKRAQHKHRLLSLSSIQRTDASVEPYSQDLTFENANTDRMQATRRKSKVYTSLPVATEPQLHRPPDIRMNRSWSCADRFCRNKKKVRNSS